MKKVQDKSNDAIEKLCRDILEKKPTVIFRSELSDITNGVFNSRTQANKDSIGTGISGRFKLFNKVAYPSEEVIRYIKGRIELCD